ncbi:MAG TPA: hypothetical protein DEF72_01315 [Gammaproteobacteria bacterium]|nr:hypothetical protein [Gammaproteobacteria bacterium]HBX26048.1 hypothetical protein [Gammaproteobacteria bacterium]
MGWFWIVLGVLAVMGSITWILPSSFERRQGERRMEALKLGMKVKILILDDWVKERLNIYRLSQYLIWTDQKPRAASLWRVPGRGDPWASPPDSENWDSPSDDFLVILNNLPVDIIGIGSENGYVWVALDDARANIEPRAIKRLLDEIMAFLIQR